MASEALHSVLVDPSAKAEALAATEGLVLLPSSNVAGYKGVSPAHHGKNYQARGNVNGTDVNLGSFETAAEAALAYARFLGPVRCVQEAQKRLPKHRGVSSEAHQRRGFGIPHGFEKQQNVNGVDDVTAVESVVADAQEDGDEDVEACTPTSVQIIQERQQNDAEVHVENVVAGMHTTRSSSMSSSASGQSIKRKRTAHIDEYEFTMPPSTRELTVPVPEGAVRAVCSITYHFA